MEEVLKLQHLPNLSSLTLHGNPIEQIKGYRLFILGIVYKKYECFKKLDSVVITRKEKDATVVWNERLNVNVKMKKLKAKNAKLPPARVED